VTPSVSFSPCHADTNDQKQKFLHDAKDFVVWLVQASRPQELEPTLEMLAQY
jgi:hypothetical protein